MDYKCCVLLCIILTCDMESAAIQEKNSGTQNVVSPYAIIITFLFRFTTF